MGDRRYSSMAIPSKLSDTTASQIGMIDASVMYRGSGSLALAARSRRLVVPPCHPTGANTQSDLTPSSQKVHTPGIAGMISEINLPTLPNPFPQSLSVAAPMLRFPLIASFVGPHTSTYLVSAAMASECTRNSSASTQGYPKSRDAACAV